jgi:hypothetical protein
MRGAMPNFRVNKKIIYLERYDVGACSKEEAERMVGGGEIPVSDSEILQEDIESFELKD